ncbi:MAG: hypothetical protein ACI4FX_10965 [Agathobacter sp.]
MTKSITRTVSAKKNLRTVQEIWKELEKVEQMSCKPNWKRPHTEDILDEEQSVRWNREEIAKQQKAYDEEVKALNTKKNKARDSLYEELYRVIRQEVGGITVEDAKKIWWFAYEEKHAYGYGDVFSFLDELMDLIGGIVNGKNG